MCSMPRTVHSTAGVRADQAPSSKAQSAGAGAENQPPLASASAMAPVNASQEQARGKRRRTPSLRVSESEHRSKLTKSSERLDTRARTPSLHARLLKPTHKNIDLPNRADPLSPYRRDIIENLAAKEAAQAFPGIDFEHVQRDLDPSFRGVLIDWLVEVVREFHLRPETLFLAKQIIDRFLAVTPISRTELQLAGVTALFIASKIEEIVLPTVDNFLYICDGTYDRRQLLAMENRILTELNFNLLFVTELPFVQRFLDAASADMPETQCRTPKRVLNNLAHFLVELSLQELRFLAYRPSVIAFSAVHIALLTLGFHPACPTLSYHAHLLGIDVTVRRKCIKDLLDTFHEYATADPAQPNRLSAVVEKYSQVAYLHVSSVTPPPRDYLP